MFLRYAQAAVTTAGVQTSASLNLPGKATGAELQAEGGDIRYTMDDATQPTTTVGMLLLAGEAPVHFLIEDVKRMRFTAVGPAATLHVHYYAGRDI